MHCYLACDERLIVGAKINLGILVWDETNPNLDISSATATCAVYGPDDSVSLASGACGISGTTLISVLRFFDTTGKSPGKYRAVFFVTLGAEVFPFQFAFLLDPLPGPQ